MVGGRAAGGCRPYHEELPRIFARFLRPGSTRQSKRLANLSLLATLKELNLVSFGGVNEGNGRSV